jgi:hypothetical protein
MARDHRRLRVFHEAHQLVLVIYRDTRNFPRDEWFGIRAQMRRAAVSVTTNIVEGSARLGTAEYVNFVNVARDRPPKSAISFCLQQNSAIFRLRPVGYFEIGATTWFRSWKHWFKSSNNSREPKRDGANGDENPEA